VKALETTKPAAELLRWRTVDIVVVALLAVAFGVVFWAWGTYVWAWGSFLGPQTESLLTGVWLLPAVVCPMIVRRPGAALFGELVAAIISALLGSYWGLDTLLSGLLQGAGAEVVFLITMYRAWNPVVAVLAAAGAGIGEAIHDLIVNYPGLDDAGRAAIGAAEIVSAIVIVGIGGWLLVRALRRTGALQTFPSGG
jgi:energy-coupling factor transport system substrate-specific component